jgi:hypothetical protein
MNKGINTTLTPEEEIAAAEENLAKLKAAAQTFTNSTDTTDSPSEEEEVTGQPEDPTSSAEDQPSAQDESNIDLVKKQYLETLFAETIINPRFWSNPKRPERLELALNIPEYDNRSLQQFAISAEDELTKEAMDFAIANECIPVKPTKEQIRARAEQKYEDKLAKDAVKTAKKNK